MPYWPISYTTVAEQFQLLEKLGAGGMGEVYRARDTRLNRIVAIKVLRADRGNDHGSRQRFFQEAQAASALNHPNIITIHDVVSSDGNDLIVMECVVGKTLSELIPKGGLRIPQVINYGLQLADALSMAHHAGIIHRDLKPGNIMVTDRGLVKVLDFGLAKLTHPPLDDMQATLASAPLTVEGSLIGTVAYMAPEQAQGKKTDARSDIFSFGSVLYEMTTGQRAFLGGNTADILIAVLRDQSRPILEIAPDVPVELVQVIEGCMRKNPDERWQSMAEVHQALEMLKQVSDSGTLYRSKIDLPAPKPPSAVRSKKKSSIGIAILAAVLVIACGSGLWWFMQRQATPAAVPAETPKQVAASTVPADGILRNANIVEMVNAKVPESLIIRQIQSTRGSFDLSAAAVIRLVQGGVPEAVIEAMHKSTEAPAAQLPSDGKPASAAPVPVPPPTPGRQQQQQQLASKDTPQPSQNAPPAEAVVIPPAPVAPVASAPGSVTLPDGTPLRLELSEDLPADAAEGAALRFSVAQDLKSNGLVVVVKGAPATGVVVEEAKKRKIFGGGSRITYRLDTVQAVDGKILRIRATPSPTGKEAAKRPLPTPKSKLGAGISAAKGLEFSGYLDGEVVVNPKP